MRPALALSDNGQGRGLARQPSSPPADPRSIGQLPLPLAGLPPEAPAPPSGPASAPPPARANTREAYRAWRAQPEGLLAWRWVAARALEASKAGQRRISTKALVERFRALHQAEVNNSYTAFLADDLLACWPELLPLIERRRRRK